MQRPGGPDAAVELHSLLDALHRQSRACAANWPLGCGVQPAEDLPFRDRFALVTADLAQPLPLGRPTGCDAPGGVEPAIRPRLRGIWPRAADEGAQPLAGAAHQPGPVGIESFLGPAELL